MPLSGPSHIAAQISLFKHSRVASYLVLSDSCSCTHIAHSSVPFHIRGPLTPFRYTGVSIHDEDRFWTKHHQAIFSCVIIMEHTYTNLGDTAHYNQGSFWKLSEVFCKRRKCFYLVSHLSSPLQDFHSRLLSAAWLSSLVKAFHLASSSFCSDDASANLTPYRIQMEHIPGFPKPNSPFPLKYGYSHCKYLRPGHNQP